ncbi:MAG: AMP-binding protein [Desulforhopalus sp.]
MTELKTLQDLVQSFRQRGDKDCLVQFGDEKTHRFSYGELYDRVTRLAGGLAAQGIGPDKVVGVIAETRYQSILISLAVINSGGTIMPIDPQFDGENLAHVLKDASPALLFAPQGQAKRVKELNLERNPDILFTDREENHEKSWFSIAEKSSGNLPEIDARDTAALFYTSGTTGKPKGVPLSHANLVFQLNALIKSGLVTEGDRLLLPLPLHHVYPFVVGMLAPLALGLALILPRALTGTQVARAIHDGKATVIVGVPRLYEALISGIESRIEAAGYTARTIGGLALKLCMFCRRTLHLQVGKFLLAKLHRQFGKQLKVLASGGAPLDPELAWRLEGLGWKVAIGYGLTETSPILTINPPGSGRVQSVGKPLSGVEIRIDEGARPKGERHQNEGGEIQAKGSGVFAEYRHLDEKTRDAFTDDRWFKTGDLGRMEDGWLRVTGRVSTMIVTRGGENVQPDEVEHAIDAHRYIKEAGVMDQDGEIKALIVPHPSNIRADGAEVDEAAHRAVNEAVRRLPSYMQPTEVVVSHNPIERTRLGKIKRHKLKEHYRRAQEKDEDEGLAPMPPERMNAEDRMLLDDPRASAAWELLVKRFPKRGLSPDANLRSDLGVDSMGWLNLSMELRGQTGIDLDEEAMARIESVRDLLKEIQQEQEKSEKEHANPVENPEKFLDDESEHWLTDLSGSERAAARLAHWFVKFFSLVYFRASTEGASNIPADKQIVFAPNHVSFLDPFVLAALIPYNVLRRTQFAGLADPAFANSFTTFFARLARAFPVDPLHKPGTGLAYGSEVLKRNRSLIWFPEGARSRTGRLGAFLPGLGMILVKRPYLVLPVYIAGTRSAMPPGSLLIRPKKVIVHFGEPVSSEDLRKEGEGKDPHERIINALKQRVAELGRQAGEET